MSSETIKKLEEEPVDNTMVSLSPTLKRLLPVYIILAFRNTAWMGSVAGPVLPLYVRQLGVDILNWGFMYTAMSVGLILFEGVFGSLSDRIDRKKMIIAASVGMGLVFPLYGLVRIVPLFFLYQFAIGAIAVAIGTTSRAMVTDFTAPETRGTYMSLWWGFFTLGSILGPVMGTYISELLGYEYAFYFSSILLLSGAVYFAFACSDGGIEHVNESDSPGLLEGFKALLRIDNVRLALILALLMYTALSSINSYFTIYASEELNVSNVTIGWMLTVSGIVRLIVIPLIGRLSDRVGQRVPLMLGLLVSSITFLFFPYVQSSWQLWAVNILLSLGFSTSSLNLVMISKDAPPNLSGMLMGLYGSFEDLGFIVGPLLYGFIWEAYMPSYIFIISGFICGLGALILVMSKKGG